jgi:ATP-dependent DNA helicase RecG
VDAFVITVAQLDRWLDSAEDEHVEFKEAKTSFNDEKLVQYCAALANETGGFLVLGISDKLPRRVVGSAAFGNLGKVKQELLNRLRLRIEVDEVQHADGRVVVFSVPSRPIGMPIQIDGAYWMRSGQSLTAMTPDRLQEIFAEGTHDFSANVCNKATLFDLDPQAIEHFRKLWSKKSRNAAFADVSAEQLLEDAELLIDGAVTYAALILLGHSRALARLLPNAETIFEYRSDDQPGPAAQRVEFRRGFLIYYDELWGLIGLRNDKQPYRDGLFVWEVSTFNEDACREAILNAISHRDYRLGGSVFIRQFPRRLVIESPGGFPTGINAENIIQRQSPRNRLLATSLARCGFVERSGQGADLMFRRCIEEGKAKPDFTHSDDHGVFLTLHGEVRDPAFVRFLERVSEERQFAFGVNELLVLANVHEETPVPANLDRELKTLLEVGAVERVARRKLVLAKRFYQLVGRPGEYTRRKGLDHDTNKQLLLAHVRSAGEAGTSMEELQQVLPAKSRPQIKRMVFELRDAGLVHMVGVKRWAKWLPGQAMDGNSDDVVPERP